MSCDDLGVGIDGGNDKDWEANACKIQLIKKKGKVKALNEEVYSNARFDLCLHSSPVPTEYSTVWEPFQG